MDFPVFESRVIELIIKTDTKIVPPLVAYRVGCTVEVALALRRARGTQVRVQKLWPREAAACFASKALAPGSARPPRY
jgi:hypothetical protein